MAREPFRWLLQLLLAEDLFIKQPSINHLGCGISYPKASGNK